MEANPGEHWAPRQEPRQRRARRAHGDITSWEHCFNDNCNEHRWEKVDAGYCPRQVGEKRTLSKHDRREHKKRRAVRARLGREGSKKSNSRCESPGKHNLGPPKPTRSRCPNHCGKGQRPRTTRQGEGKTPTSIQSSQTEDAPNKSHALKRRSLASWNRCKREKGAKSLGKCRSVVHGGPELSWSTKGGCGPHGPPGPLQSILIHTFSNFTENLDQGGSRWTRRTRGTITPLGGPGVGFTFC